MHVSIVAQTKRSELPESGDRHLFLWAFSLGPPDKDAPINRVLNVRRRLFPL